MPNITEHTRWIKEEAHRLGFSYAGISRAEQMEEEARRLEAWLNKGRHGDMAYMANHFDKRTDPRKLVPGARSVISLMYNYYTEETQEDPEAPKISKYAYGKDYHFVLKRKLKSLFYFIEEKIGKVEGRVFVDSAPVLERDWARRSGLGWMGKNTMLIHPRAGSYFFLAEVILDLELKDLDGMELLHALKERDPYLPVIVLSEREHMQNAINAVREGADDYILKPFGVEEIRASVDTAFSKRIRIMKERQDGSPRESTLTLDVERISEQARREFASGARDLRLLEEFNRRSIENLMHGVLLLDSDFHVIHLNRLAMEMAGVSRPEGEPVHIAQLAPLLADSRLMTALEQVRAGQETVVLNDFWLQDPGGGTRGLHKVIVQHTPLVDDEFLLVQVENILDSRLLREETRKVRMQVARQIYGRVAQHLQVIAGRGELLQLRDEHSHGNLQQILDASREIGRILTELGTDMHETEEGEAG